jgi:D-alanine transfer protein
MAETSAAQPSEARVPHLVPALVAICFVAAIVACGFGYARQLESRYIHAVAPEMNELKYLGSALHAEAFRHSDLLPVYGSSELRLLSPYHASALFRTYPSGFTIFPVGKQGTTCLLMLQDLAAVGSAIRGKKVAISLSPSWFFVAGAVGPPAYAGNFTRLHAGALAFSLDLRHSTKQGAARRMLQYPEPLEADPLLRFALEKLADGSPLSLALYYTLLPLGKLENLILRLQDHAETLAYILDQPYLSEVSPHREIPLDWEALLTGAEEYYQPQADNNPFGFNNRYYSNNLPAFSALPYNPRTDQQFLKTLNHAEEWTDLRLLLQVLDELGAEPLVLSIPIPGDYYDSRGVSSAARQVFYEQLRAITRAHGMPDLSFADHDHDKYFLMHPGHPSHKGLAYHARVLDAFYHGAPPTSAPPVAMQDRGQSRPIAPSEPPTSRVAVQEAGQSPKVSPRDAPTTKATEPRRASYLGNHEVTNGVQISGWAWDTTRPDTPIKVDIYDGDQLLASVLADRLRQDLKNGGKGDGKHGFRYRVPESLKDGKTHVIRIKISGTSIELKGTPKTLGGSGDDKLAAASKLVAASKPFAASRPAYAGHHQATTSERITGWAWDGSQPDTPVKVDLYDGDQLLATILADRFRQDLKKGGKGDGRHGFVCSVPPSLKDGKKHMIRIRISGTSIDLKSTPQTLEFPPP